MTWNSVWPVGTVSVKENRTTGNQNTSYIETIMGKTAPDIAYQVTDKDHFWNVGSDLSGHHRFIKSPGYTVATVPTDPGPDLGAGIDTILYAKTTNATTQWFQRNAQGIYQVTPTLLSGTIAIPSEGSYTTIIAVPANVYGDIFMWNDTEGRFRGQTGFFKSNATIVDAWSLWLNPQGFEQKVSLKFGNGSEADLLNIRARRDSAANLTWNYRITYRAM